jgi:hypothetical protein
LFDTYLPKNTYGIIEYSYNFIDCDCLKITEMRDTDIIVLGGGDIPEAGARKRTNITDNFSCHGRRSVTG